jgi:uncharacterized protein YfbU (UPF0304 family)
VVPVWTACFNIYKQCVSQVRCRYICFARFSQSKRLEFLREMVSDQGRDGHFEFLLLKI